jgi:hypothetical protein
MSESRCRSALGASTNLVVRPVLLRQTLSRKDFGPSVGRHCVAAALIAPVAGRSVRGRPSAAQSGSAYRGLGSRSAAGPPVFDRSARLPIHAPLSSPTLIGCGASGRQRRALLLEGAKRDVRVAGFIRDSSRRLLEMMRLRGRWRLMARPQCFERQNLAEPPTPLPSSTPQMCGDPQQSQQNGTWSPVPASAFEGFPALRQPPTPLSVATRILRPARGIVARREGR